MVCFQVVLIIIKETISESARTQIKEVTAKLSLRIISMIGRFQRFTKIRSSAVKIGKVQCMGLFCKRKLKITNES